MRKIFAIIFMLGFIFTANAEIKKGKVDGNKTYYSVVNKQINAVYVCEDADFYTILKEAVQSLGKPYYAIDNNSQINSEVAAITKLHGNSQTFIDNYFVMNTYDKVTNTYQTFIW